jgi:hypothetical protein
MNIEAAAVSARINALVDEQDRQHAVDVIVRRSPWSIIPELGMGGSCYEPSLATIVVAPESEAFERSFEEGAFGMTLAHELHHALRHAVCGYGATLGEAIVSEGLADHFATEVTGCAPPIWTDADLSPAVIERAEGELSGIVYHHAEWFFGRGGLPRWAGYAMGWRLVASYLSLNPDESAAGLVGVNAASILSAAWPDLAERRGRA